MYVDPNHPNAGHAHRTLAQNSVLFGQNEINISLFVTMHVPCQLTITLSLLLVCDYTIMLMLSSRRVYE